MSEGKKVRIAMDGPDIEHDALIDQIEARNREDSRRASSAGESRQKIGEFLDETSMNSKAFSWMRSTIKLLEKPDGEEKAMDVIRSLEKALPMVKDHVGGQGTADWVDQAENETVEAGDDPQAVEPIDFDEDDQETREFNEAVDDVADPKGNVVTPIGLGAA